MQNLICYVEECKYYQGKKCTAPAVTVESSVASLAPCCSEETACATFVPRNQ